MSWTLHREIVLENLPDPNPVEDQGHTRLGDVIVKHPYSGLLAWVESFDDEGNRQPPAGGVWLEVIERVVDEKVIGDRDPRPIYGLTTLPLRFDLGAPGRLAVPGVGQYILRVSALDDVPGTHIRIYTRPA